MRILFVDNHPEFTAVVISTFLGEHEVIVVATIAGARLALETATFDVALVDYDLDDGKGDELVRWIRGRAISLPLIAVSARAEGNQTLVDAGVDGVCAKTTFAGIRAVLAEVCRQRVVERRCAVGEQVSQLPEVLVHMFKTYFNVDCFTKDWVDRVKHALLATGRDASFRSALADAINRDTVTPAQYERLTYEDFDTQEDLNQWLRQVWADLYGDAPIVA